jgi:hypothetical protein
VRKELGCIHTSISSWQTSQTHPYNGKIMSYAQEKTKTGRENEIRCHKPYFAGIIEVNDELDRICILIKLLYNTQK